VKTVALGQAKMSLGRVVVAAQRERVLTKHGKPAALVIGVEGQDIEDVLLSQDPEFWKLVEARRQQPTLSIADVRARLGVAPKPAPPPTAEDRGAQAVATMSPRGRQQRCFALSQRIRTFTPEMEFSRCRSSRDFSPESSARWSSSRDFCFSAFRRSKRPFSTSRLDSRTWVRQHRRQP